MMISYEVKSLENSNKQIQRMMINQKRVKKMLVICSEVNR